MIHLQMEGFAAAQDEWNQEQLHSLFDVLHEKRRHHEEENLTLMSQSSSCSTDQALSNGGEEPPLGLQ